ncbi:MULTISPECIES: hypothetical protein [unclassified Pseudomonas]|uniref:Uncharacterized protein n=2 Tax=viral metagenome TaxID=1070528 RepID=A0A6M3XBT7_9ZZZZ|nr:MULTISPECIES: hypothetical protein [unclassified Pseudomonas]VXD04119.1 conserved hypothetical protein [Pseudomonas sp. 9Ag]
MTMELELSQLIGWATGLLSIFVGIVTGLVKLLLGQFEKRLADRFAAQDAARQSASRHWEESFAKLLDRQDKEAETVKQLERAFMRFQADLPLEYVRREDWVRGQSVIEAKLDGLALKFENVLLKGARHD